MQAEASDQDDTTSQVSPEDDSDSSSNHSHSPTEAESHITRASSVSPTHSEMLALGNGQPLPAGLTHTIYEGNADDFPTWKRDLSANDERSIHSSAFHSVHQVADTRTTEPASPPRPPHAHPPHAHVLARQPGNYSNFRNRTRWASGEIDPDEDMRAFVGPRSPPANAVAAELKRVGQGPATEMRYCPNCAQAVRYTDRGEHQEVCKRTYVGHPSWPPFKGKKKDNNDSGRGAGASSIV